MEPVPVFDNTICNTKVEPIKMQEMFGALIGVATHVFGVQSLFRAKNLTQAYMWSDQFLPRPLFSSSENVG